MIRKLINFLLIAASAESFAASDGSTGSSSSGSAGISINLTKLIKVTQMTDMAGTYSGVGVLQMDDIISVATNYGTAGTRLYSVTMTGSGVSGAFSISNGTDFIPYTATFNDGAGAAGAVSMLSGTKLAGQTGANAVMSDDSLNAYYRIELSEADLQAASSGAYSGTITVVMEPQ